jgi:cytidylate kinase
MRPVQAASDRWEISMSVITISRGSFSGGKILAECLAQRLGYRCIDRDVIVERAAAYGVSQREIAEAMEKSPTFLERFKHKRYLYLALVQAALTEEVRTGRAVYHGLAGHLLLKGGRPILRTRIIAPMEMRIQMIRKRLKYSRSEAIACIEKVDDERRKWTQFLYGVDWGDPALYDMVINLEYIHIEEACRIIASTSIERCFEFTPECQRRMNDLALASRIRADLAINRSTSDLEVEVVADNSAVSIMGKLSQMAQLGEVKRIASGAGATSLNLDKLAPPVRE